MFGCWHIGIHWKLIYCKLVFGQRAEQLEICSLIFFLHIAFMWTSIQQMPAVRLRTITLSHCAPRSNSHSSIRDLLVRWKECTRKKKADNFKCSANHEIERRNPCCCHYGSMNSVRALSLAIWSVHSFPNWLKLDLLDLGYRKLKWFLISDKNVWPSGNVSP